MNPTNVVLFIVDGLRTDMLGCYGGALADTPHIDAFAAEGRLLRRSFCTHSVCMPTRASIFTGRYPHIHGVWANGLPLPSSEITLPQVLGDAGYATGASGKIHFEPQQAYTDGICPIITGSYYGFEEVHLCENRLGQEYLDWVRDTSPESLDIAKRRRDVPEEIHELHWITSQAIDFMARSASTSRPFLCSCSYHELSPPSSPPPGFLGYTDPEDVPIPGLDPEDLALRPPFYRQCYEGYIAQGKQPDEPTLRRHIASAYDQIRFIDRQFGRVVAALKQLGIWENTAVLFTADHGLSYCDHYQWRHGPFLFDQVTNVPMIWRVPGMARPGAETGALVEGVDIMPTALDLCGVPAPPGVQGRSMAPLLLDVEGAEGRDSVLVQEHEAPDLAARGLPPESVSQIGVRTADRKLIHYPGCPYGELYDLDADPGEFRNLWDDPGYRDVRRDMEVLLMDRMADARDPLPEREYQW
ncbi:MAG: sulfatase-like hydrolase/transferase [Candidatus Latescibacteria bacterium]|jgi:arylsulfatase A-like enzyme|nr:sulfatase-like hydrolase/transferase [Candidatus Latescibacterota bacterium]